MKEDLDELLRSWRPEAPESATFNRDVWRRIKQFRSAGEWLEELVAWLSRPGIASFATALAILGGALIGSAIANQSGEFAYLRAVDPYAQVLAK